MTKIGSGAFANVFFDSEHAVKVYKEVEKFEASKEIKALIKLKSNRTAFKKNMEEDFGLEIKSSVVTIKKWIYSKNSDVQVYFKRYACNLLELMQETKIDIATAKHIFYRIMIGIAELQFSHLIHGDLKPENILVGHADDISDLKKIINHVKSQKDPTKIIVKIIDFNKVVDEHEPIKPLDIQTLYYTPPEIILGCRDYTSSVDIWTAACMLYEMLSYKHLFNVYNKDDCFDSDSELDSESESESESESGSSYNLYEKLKIDHLALLHIYNLSMGNVPEWDSAEFSEDYMSNGFILGSCGVSSLLKLWGSWCTLVDTIFERTFHYDYNNRLSFNEYISLYGRDNKR